MPFLVGREHILSDSKCLYAWYNVPRPRPGGGNRPRRSWGPPLHFLTGGGTQKRSLGVEKMGPS